MSEQPHSEASPEKSVSNQFALLGQRRFLPFFLTQFLGAFNDNVYKNTLILMLAFYVTVDLPFSSDLLINAAALLFILPFFLFSATAGQIADKYDKAWLMRRIKTAEIAIMLLAAVALVTGSLFGLFLLLFLMGTQSAFFGPVKYALLPQHLHEDELVGGNGQVETGTFVAILLGLVVANVLTGQENSSMLVAASVVLFAVAGRVTSGYIPSAPAAAPDLKINWNIFTQTRVIMRYATEDHAVFHAIIGISWFWFVGSIYLTQMPNFTRDFLHGSADVTTMVLCVFSLGIGIGSLLCEKLSGKKIEIGLVPFGAMGLSIFAIDLYFVMPIESAEEMLSIASFLVLDGSWHLLFSLLMIGMFGGFFIVPLFALVQQRSKPERRAQIIAANNIINALFMVTASLLAVLALDVASLNIPELFLVVALMNIAVTVFIFTRVPEFSMRFLIWLLSHTMYRVQHKNLDVVPDEGGAIIVCNHVSYVDALLLAGAVKRPIRFIMFKPIFDVPVLNFIFRTGRAIPIVSQHVDQLAYNKAFDDIAEGLFNGDLLCIFPEGKLTTDGEMNEFKTGIEKILSRTPVPVIPFALQGLWGSFFSHDGGKALTRLPKRFWSHVNIVAGDKLSPISCSANDLQEAVSALRGGQK